jgi:ammonium transporter Rh
MRDGIIYIGWLEVLDAGFAAATILISFGVVIGKTTPNQLLIMSLIEVPIFIANGYIGVSLFGAIDTGKVFYPR